MVDSTRPVRVRKLRGQVTRGTYGAGTKSEREAVFIDTDRGRFVVRRKGGPVFADPSLECYVGHDVTCDGFLIGTTMLVERIDLIG